MAFDNVEIDTLGHRLFVDGEEVGLEPKAFAVLVLLLSEPGRVWTRDEILDEVWGHNHVTPSVLTRIIGVLRHALGESGEDSHYLHTVHGIGFRLDAEVRSAASREALTAGSALAGAALAFAPVLTSSVAATPVTTIASPEAPVQTGKTRRFNRRVVAAIWCLFVVAALLLGWHQFTHHPENASPVVDQKSVAVLPFENLSADQNNAYFASGIQDMILTRLVGIGGLKVIARVSTEKYPSHPADVKTIARQLDVATLLEGTVQKAGNKVLVNVQLIDANSGNHLWAKAYAGTFDDVFKVEGEVAQNVAESLKVQLTSDETARIDTLPTSNAAAYDLFLQAGAHANRAYDNGTWAATELPLAISLYQQALARDPNYALAWAALARAHMVMYFMAGDHSNAQLANAKAAADRALALQPNLGLGHYALALYDYWAHRDYAGAITQAELARQSLPNGVMIDFLIAYISCRQGRWDEAAALFHAATVLDPHNALAFGRLGDTYESLRRYAEADQAFAAAVPLSSNPLDQRILQAENEVFWKGDLAPLRTALAALPPGSDYYAVEANYVYWERWLARDFAGAAKVAEADKAEDWLDPNNISLPRRLYVAWALQAAGDTSRATTIYAEVAAHARTTLVEHPDEADLHLTLAYAYAGLGRKPEAAAEGERAVALRPVSQDALEGPDVLKRVADIYVRVGQREQAITLIGWVLSMPAGNVLSTAMLRIDPTWDPLRDDPRFKALLVDTPEPVNLTLAPPNHPGPKSGRK
jgi:serine/threonine-protein kinase